jgi:hypothetical protein
LQCFRLQAGWLDSVCWSAYIGILNGPGSSACCSLLENDIIGGVFAHSSWSPCCNNIVSGSTAPPASSVIVSSSDLQTAAGCNGVGSNSGDGGGAVKGGETASSAAVANHSPLPQNSNSSSSSITPLIVSNNSSGAAPLRRAMRPSAALFGSMSAQNLLGQRHSACRRIVALSLASGMPCPLLSTCLSFLDATRLKNQLTSSVSH